MSDIMRWGYPQIGFPRLREVMVVTNLPCGTVTVSWIMPANPWNLCMAETGLLHHQHTCDFLLCDSADTVLLLLLVICDNSHTSATVICDNSHNNTTLPFFQLLTSSNWSLCHRSLFSLWHSIIQTMWSGFYGWRWFWSGGVSGILSLEMTS